MFGALCLLLSRRQSVALTHVCAFLLSNFFALANCDYQWSSLSPRFFGSAHRSMVDTPLVNEKFGDQVLFIIGCVLFFGFTTMISVRCDMCILVNSRSCRGSMLPRRGVGWCISSTAE